MVAQPIHEFMSATFLKKACGALKELGFLSDEHEFAPYRETLNTYFVEIGQALAAQGCPIQILPGFLEHSRAGYAYFIYDSDHFANSIEAA